MCFVRCPVCLSEVEKKRKRNSSRQEIRKGVTTCLHLYIPKSFPSYDHVRWRKHLNYQGQQHGEFRHSHLRIIKRCLANVLGEGEGTGWLERRSPMVWTGLLEHAMELAHHAHQNSSTSQQGGENATSRECCSQILKKEVIREVGKAAFPSCRAEDCVLELKEVGRSEYIP